MQDKKLLSIDDVPSIFRQNNVIYSRDAIKQAQPNVSEVWADDVDPRVRELAENIRASYQSIKDIDPSITAHLII